MLRTGPCETWPLDFDCTPLPDGTTDAEIAKWSLVASQILWALSGRRYGPCPITVRPCLKRCSETVSYGAANIMTPYIRNGQWYNFRGCGCVNSCSCTEMCTIQLEGPVYDVVEMREDGAVIDPADYRVDQPNELVFQNGYCPPTCQDMNKPAGDVGTFSVTYRIGLPIDPMGIIAVSNLTAELIRDCHGDENCRLPPDWARIVRQGLTIERDKDDDKRDGLGIREVDMWLDIVNPNRLPQPARVYSPDLKRPRVTTWP